MTPYMTREWACAPCWWGRAWAWKPTARSILAGPKFPIDDLAPLTLIFTRSGANSEQNSRKFWDMVANKSSVVFWYRISVLSRSPLLARTRDGRALVCKWVRRHRKSVVGRSQVYHDGRPLFGVGRADKLTINIQGSRSRKYLAVWS